MLQESFERRTAAQSKRAYLEFQALNHRGSMMRAEEGLKGFGLRPIKASSNMLKVTKLT
jgi:hypothetical protein